MADNGENYVVDVRVNARRVLLLAGEDEDRYVAAHIAQRQQGKFTDDRTLYLAQSFTLPTGDWLSITSRTDYNGTVGIFVQGGDYDLVLARWQGRLLSCLQQYLVKRDDHQQQIDKWNKDTEEANRYIEAYQRRQAIKVQRAAQQWDKELSRERNKQWPRT